MIHATTWLDFGGWPLRGGIWDPKDSTAYVVVASKFMPTWHHLKAFIAEEYCARLEKDLKRSRFLLDTKNFTKPAWHNLVLRKPGK